MHIRTQITQDDLDMRKKLKEINNLLSSLSPEEREKILRTVRKNLERR